jgi:hypothetical protein
MSIRTSLPADDVALDHQRGLRFASPAYNLIGANTVRVR